MRILIVGRSRLRLPLDDSLREKKPALRPRELVRELDDATAIVLPSRSEGRAGGIVDEVRDGENWRPRRRRGR